MWCIPPKHSVEIIFQVEPRGSPDMEDVLEVCMDETFKQLIGETREPLPAQPGTVERYDHIYTRNGVASLFMASEPLASWRHVAATEHRCRSDWALFIRDLLDGSYLDAERVVLVMDQLNTHSPASLYQAFPTRRSHQPKPSAWPTSLKCTTRPSTASSST